MALTRHFSSGEPSRELLQRGSLNRQVIAATAVALIEERGVEQLTMRALAQALGRGTMSLYTHVRSREDLLDAVVEQLISDMDATGAATAAIEGDGGWQESLVAALGEYRQLAERYPRSFELLALSSYDEGPVAPHFARVVKVLQRAGLSEPNVELVLDAADSYATGFLVVWARARARVQANGAPEESEATRGSGPRSIELFDRGVEVVIRGIESVLAGRE